MFSILAMVSEPKVAVPSDEGECDRLRRCAEVDGVDAGAAVVLVGAVGGVIGDQEHVVAVVAPQPVIALAADDGVVAAIAEDEVVAVATLEPVLAVAAFEDVVADAAEHHVVAAEAADAVVAGLRVDGVVTVPCHRCRRRRWCRRSAAESNTVSSRKLRFWTRVSPEIGVSAWS